MRPAMASGDAVSMNSHRFRLAASLARSSKVAVIEDTKSHRDQRHLVDGKRDAVDLRGHDILRIVGCRDRDIFIAEPLRAGGVQAGETSGRTFRVAALPTSGVDKEHVSGADR